uniref:Solute carrier family 25 member 40 n=1 Tax=Timema bartmani TaxID=61472 RepID=A0A7R9ERJ6_9NEOP|nr:unnamed protein product [Timema bartmani]
MILVTPFDVVKIRMQAQQKKISSNRCFLYCNGLMDHLCPCVNGMNGSTGQTGNVSSPSTAWYRRQGHFTGTVVSISVDFTRTVASISVDFTVTLQTRTINVLFVSIVAMLMFEQDAFVKISHTEGVSSLWSGLSPTLVLAVPATIVYFVSYENLRLYIKDSYGGNQPFWAPMVAGATARSVSVSLVSPLELVRTKMQSKRISYLEIGEALKTLLHYHGVGGLFKGLGSTLLRDVPFSAIYWFNYEGIKAKFSTGVPSFGFSFMAGAVAGSIAAILTNPFDVVKTHQQIELGEKEIYSDPPKRGSSMLTVLQRIYQQSGTRGLFTGLVPRLVKVAPACAIMISTFEYGKYFFHSTWGQVDQEIILRNGVLIIQKESILNINIKLNFDYLKVKTNSN